MRRVPLGLRMRRASAKGGEGIGGVGEDEGEEGDVDGGGIDGE